MLPYSRREDISVDLDMEEIFGLLLELVDATPAKMCVLERLE
jgi:hypothetical protein